jgi:hypothetical protein
MSLPKVRNLSFAILVGFASAACSGGAAEQAAAPAPAPEAAHAAKPAEAPAPTPAAQPSGPAPSSVEDPTFSLRLVGAGPYKAGELGRFVLELTPKGEYHVNKEYPIEIALTAPAEVMLPKAQLARPDAAEFGDTKAKFDIPFTPKSAGALAVNANVKFAVCTEENCVPDERNLTLALAVQ